MAIRRQAALGFDGDEMEVVGDFGEFVEDFGRRFVLDCSEDDGGFFTGKFAEPGFDDSAGSVGIVSGVEDEVFANSFKASRPVNVGERVLHDVEGQVVAGGDDRFAGEGGIVLLVFAGEGERVTEERLGDEVERGAGLIGHLADSFFGLGVLRRGETRFTFDGDGRFFTSDGVESVAEPFGVIERDWGENADISWDGGGGVEATTHAGFEDDEVAIAVAEVSHRESESEFKKGRVGFPIRHEIAKFGEEGGGFSFRDLESIDADSFAVVDEVWGGKKAGAQGQSLGEGVDHGAGRALAVGACDVDDLGAVGREGEEFAKEAGGAFEAQFDPEGLGGVKPVECFLVIHAGGSYRMEGSAREVSRG